MFFVLIPVALLPTSISILIIAVRVIYSWYNVLFLFCFLSDNEKKEEKSANVGLKMTTGSLSSQSSQLKIETKSIAGTVSHGSERRMRQLVTRVKIDRIRVLWDLV